MTRPANAERIAHFRRNHLLWLSTAHLLSADLLRELVMAVVQEVGQGSIGYHELFDEQISEGAPHLASWALFPKPCNAELARFLQDVARHLAWGNDNPPGVGPDPNDAMGPVKRPVVTALELAKWDFYSITPGYGELPPPLGDVVAAVASLGKASDRRDWRPPKAITTAEAPLSAVLLKHLGDLCVDDDDWASADGLYAAAQAALPRDHGPWAGFVKALEDILAQSRSAAAWGAQGASAAVPLYEAGQGIDPNTRPLAAINSAQDRLNVHVAGADHFYFPEDLRSVVVVAPQLAAAHDQSNGYWQWLSGKHRDANRWFWSALRRQIALGTLGEAQALKAAYGRCMIDGLKSQLPQHVSPDDFGMAVRLLVQSGSVEAVAATTWDERLLAAYLQPSAVADAIHCALRAPGFTLVRQRVLIAIFQRWLKLMPPGGDDSAVPMLEFLARGTVRYSADVWQERNLPSECMKALADVGRSRPEFGRLAADEIVAGLRQQLQDGRWNGVSEALETLDVYSDTMSEEQLRTSLEVVLAVLDRIADRTNWVVARPALNLLVSDAATNALIEAPDLRKRVAEMSVRLALAQESEHVRLLLLLRNQSSDFASHVDSEKLFEIAKDLRARAHQTNSSAAPGCIYALLAAPAIAGREGFEDALRALRKGLASVLGNEGVNPPALAFPYLYESILLLCQDQDKLTSDLKVDRTTYHGLLVPIRDTLVEVWRHAPQNPLIFAPFRIPPANAPNSVVVHNWTYASLVLDETLGRPDEQLEEAVALAAGSPALAGGIASGRASRATFHDPAELNLTRLSDEPRDAFYGALGARLARLPSLSDAKKVEAAAALVEQCFRLGPNGLDAGVFIAALNGGLAGHLPRGAPFLDYRRRAENERDLRLGLIPLLDALHPLSAAPT